MYKFFIHLSIFKSEKLNIYREKKISHSYLFSLFIQLGMNEILTSFSIVNESNLKNMIDRQEKKMLKKDVPLSIDQARSNS